MSALEGCRLLSLVTPSGVWTFSCVFQSPEGQTENSQELNVDAESVKKRRRPKAGREASNANNDRYRRVIGDGMVQRIKESTRGTSSAS